MWGRLPSQVAWLRSHGRRAHPAARCPPLAALPGLLKRLIPPPSLPSSSFHHQVLRAGYLVGSYRQGVDCMARLVALRSPLGGEIAALVRERVRQRVPGAA